MTVLARIERLIGGNHGDVKPVGDGVSELRINYGPGTGISSALVAIRPESPRAHPSKLGLICVDCQSTCCRYTGGQVAPRTTYSQEGASRPS